MRRTDILFSVAAVLFGVLLSSTAAVASEQTGTISTGVSTGMEGTVVAAPIASPVAGTYASARSVVLTATGASSIHFTTNGTTPDCSSGTTYSGAIAVSTSKTIKAISCYPNSVSSSVASFTYTISSGGGGGGGGGYYMTPTESSIEGADTSSSGRGAMTRDQANLQLPTGFPVDSLVKLANDGNFGTQADSTVYYLGLDAKRHPFINSAAYFSWETDFSMVRIMDGPTLASIPLGAPILVRPGTFWVKIMSDVRTYYVEPGYKLSWIKDEAAANKLGGPYWNQNIIDVDPAFFTLFSYASDIDTTTLATTWPAGTVIDSSLNILDDRNLLGLRYYVTRGKKRAFVPASAFTANNFQSRFAWNHAADTGSTDVLRSLPSGTDIVGREDALFSLMH